MNSQGKDLGHPTGDTDDPRCNPSSSSVHIDEESVRTDQIAEQHWLSSQQDTMSSCDSSEYRSDEENEPPAPSKTPSTSGEGGGTIGKVVPRDYLPTDTAITSTHVAAAFPEDYNKASESQRSSWLAIMNKERQDCRSWAALKIEQIFVEEARVQNLDVHTMADIKLKWKKDGSDEMANKMFAILYGTFDARPNWARVLEEEYMTDYAKFTYSKEANTVGCFESLISHKKSAMVVNVNNATRDTHNRRINISRRKDMITDKNRFQKRMKGVFDARYVVGECKDSKKASPRGSVRNKVSRNKKVSFRPRVSFVTASF